MSTKKGFVCGNSLSLKLISSSRDSKRGAKVCFPSSLSTICWAPFVANSHCWQTSKGLAISSIVAKLLTLLTNFTVSDHLCLLCNTVRTQRKQLELVAMPLVVALLPNFSILHCCQTSVSFMHCLHSFFMKTIIIYICLLWELGICFVNGTLFHNCTVAKLLTCFRGYLLSDFAILHNNSNPKSINHSTLLPKFAFVSSYFMIFVSSSHSCSCAALCT